MSQLGTEAFPVRVAIIGSGPSGFYAAESLLKSDTVVEVDLFDRLPTPYGLVRGGVAPDHPKIKNVIRVYEKIARNDRLRFLGNVMAGRDLALAELQCHYDAIIIASGAETDNRLGIPGEDLSGSHTATEFVGWYNGHPDYRDREFDLSCEVAVVVGQGNVAMDVSRILAKTPDELRHTDIADYALDALAESKIREIHLVGRRGPVQAKFTQPEIKEIGELAACDPVVDPDDLSLNEASQIELDDPSNHHSRKNWAVLQDFAGRGAPSKQKQYFVHFYKSPVELRGDGKVEQVVLQKNHLVGEPFKQKARHNGEVETLNCGLFFRSVGYRGVPFPGVPFDEERGLIANAAGRVVDQAVAVPGLYVTGWIKRGPSGVIGTNKPDSVETVKALLEDLPVLPPCPVRDSGEVMALLEARGVRAVTFEDWSRIDAAEVERGKVKDKPREKFTRIEEMLGVLDESPHC